jgi:hypothetical protein
MDYMMMATLQHNGVFAYFPHLTHWDQNARSDLKKATLQMGVAESSYNITFNILSMTLSYIHVTFKDKMLNG